MRSMTGFGQASGENERHAVTVTLRGVNHRFLELRLHLADEHRSSEEAMRALLASRLARGRVESTVEVRPLAPPEARVRVDREVVRAAHDAVEALVAEKLVAGGLVAGDLLRLPEALVVERSGDRWEEADDELLLAVTGTALAQMVAAREAEGASLRQILTQRVAALEEVVAALSAERDRVRAATGEALRARLADLLADRGIDEARLAQEAAILVEKSDVAEELDRLGAHCSHFRELLGGADAADAVGKRMDFLAQEIGRELNTVGAKCRDAAMTRAVLDGKLLCEQLREQVQNVE